MTDRSKNFTILIYNEQSNRVCHSKGLNDTMMVMIVKIYHLVLLFSAVNTVNILF